MPKALLMIGTRPELVKVAPLIMEMKRRGLRKHLIVVNTGQHRELMTNTFNFLGIKPDYTLDLMVPGQSLNDLMGRALLQFQKLLNELLEKNEKIKIILGQGDTATAFASAMTAFHNRIPFAHIEAGLRTNDLENPFPEEYYRKAITIGTFRHFAPTASACQCLLDEGVDPSKILLTGNTVVDSISNLRKLEKLKGDSELFNTVLKEVEHRDKMVLITCHRRENFGNNIKKIISSVKDLSHKYPDHSFVWIRHPNPNVKTAVEKSGIDKLRNVHTIEPLDYFDLVKLYPHVKILITDSGGLQEEAPSFNIPVIILREATERIESVNAGFAFLCGADPAKIKAAFHKIKQEPPVITYNPYGDGLAALRISDWLQEYLRRHKVVKLIPEKIYERRV